jgi:4,5-dihydroxyphthalate decarboxylase
MANRKLPCGYKFLQRPRAGKGAPASASIPPFGVEANRKALQMAIDWSLEQRIIPRRLPVDELFDDVTAALKV